MGRKNDRAKNQRFYYCYGNGLVLELPDWWTIHGCFKIPESWKSPGDDVWIAERDQTDSYWAAKEAREEQEAEAELQQDNLSLEGASDHEMPGSEDGARGVQSPP